MVGELRLCLEGYGSQESLCAACMALESAIIAFGREADALEEGGNMDDVSDCLRQLHRAIADIHQYCADLSGPDSDGQRSEEPLPLLARVAAVWQLEDPR